eukprot:1072840-Pyramimonas_sp.AAC.1
MPRRRLPARMARPHPARLASSQYNGDVADPSVKTSPVMSTSWPPMQYHHLCVSTGGGISG